MGIVLFEIVVIAILVICLWVAWKYILLVMSKSNADKAFSKLAFVLQKNYDNIELFLNSSLNFIGENRDFINKILENISKAKDFSIEKDGNERIIGYANSILNSTQEILDILENSNNSEEINCLCQRYKASHANFITEKNNYNLKAQQLRHYVDVFPTSLISRFKNIKTMDYIECK